MCVCVCVIALLRAIKSPESGTACEIYTGASGAYSDSHRCQ